MMQAATRLGDGRVLISGGVGAIAVDAGVSAAVRPLEAYDPATRRWIIVGALLETRAGHTATLLDDGRVLMVGGAATATTEIFDPATGRPSRPAQGAWLGTGTRRHGSMTAPS